MGRVQGCIAKLGGRLGKSKTFVLGPTYNGSMDSLSFGRKVQVSMIENHMGKEMPK